MEVTRRDINFGKDTEIVMKISDLDIFGDRQIMQEVLKQAARHVADYMIANHWQEIVAKVSPDAIATLACANSAKEIANGIREGNAVAASQKNIEIYEKGLFGGMRRVR